jgi:uncharacterized protein YacL
MTAIEKAQTTARLKSEKQISAVSDVALFRKTYSVIGIEPKMSVIRPHVKMVDANLAYKYADLQSDFTQFVSFATLFLGICIGSLISLIISLLDSPIDRVVVAIYVSAFIITLAVTAIFGGFAFSAAKKAKEEKVNLETTQGLTTLNLGIRTEVSEENGE